MENVVKRQIESKCYIVAISVNMFNFFLWALNIYPYIVALKFKVVYSPLDLLTLVNSMDVFL